MAQHLKATAAFTEGLSLVSSTHVGWLATSGNSSSRASNASGFYEHLHLHAHTHVFLKNKSSKSNQYYRGTRLIMSLEELQKHFWCFI